MSVLTSSACLIFSVAGYEDHRLISETLYPALTTVELPYRRMGERAVDLLLARISGEGIVTLPELAVRREDADGHPSLLATTTRVYNFRNPVRDHVACWRNREQFVAAIAHLILPGFWVPRNVLEQGDRLRRRAGHAAIVVRLVVLAFFFVDGWQATQSYRPDMSQEHAEYLAETGAQVDHGAQVDRPESSDGLSIMREGEPSESFMPT